MKNLVNIRRRGARAFEESPEFRLIDSAAGTHLFVSDGSRVYGLQGEAPSGLRAALQHPESPESGELINRLRATFVGEARIDGTPLAPPGVRSLSLNVAQGCNLACTYCYADEGRFGGDSRAMSSSVARQAVDRLLADAEPGVDVVVGFMGGEPLLAADLVHEITRYAARQAHESRHRVRFSITTNGTRVTARDASLFARHAFSVSVSLDGNERQNDETRPTHRGEGSYAAMRAGLEHLLGERPGHLSGRLTVTPARDDLLSSLDHVLSLGFDDAGFAPVLVAPDPSLAFEARHFEQFLKQMIACGAKAKAELRAGRRYPFTNFETALNEIHRGSHRPYPCGAGAAYLSVSAEGELFACHRLIDDPKFAMGDLQSGSDLAARTRHLERSHVDLQEPCRSCWARYLCGGGCYHEVEARGRISCDYVRGWLEFCIASYAELSTSCPQYFHNPEEFFRDGELS